MIDSCLNSFLHGVSVVPIRRNSKWAKDELFVKAGVRYNDEMTPYIEEISNACSYDSDCEQITFVKAQQTGGTLGIIVADIGQTMHQNPDNIIYGAPSGSFALKFSRLKIDQMIKNSYCLQNIVSDASSRDGTNTTLAKQFPGGTLYIVSAGSSGDWRMIDARTVYLDEYDIHPDDLNGEGSGKDIADGRTASKGDKAKIILVSTPVDAIKSKIWPEYLLGSQEHYYVPCPFCKFKQVMKWENFVYEKKDADSIKLKCINLECGKLIDEKYKTWMMAKENGAEWIAHNPNRQNKRHRSFHLPAFYSPVNFISWRKICQKWFGATEDRMKMKAFKHLVEAIPFQESEESETQVEELMARRYKFSAIVPKEVLLLTAFCDVQDNRLEVVTWGWGLNDQSWRIDKEVFCAPEGRKVDHPIVWEQLEIYRKKTFTHENGNEIAISAMGVDTGGHFADQAYSFVKGKYSERCFATKGSSIHGAPLVSRPTKSNKGKIPLHLIGTDTAKRTIMARLRAKKASENGYVHLRDDMTDEEIKQLLSEKLLPKRVKNAKGVFESVKIWQKIRERNEEFDCFFGSYVVMKMIRPNFVALQEIYSVENRENIPETIESEYTEPEKSDTIQENTENVVDNDENIINEAETNEEEETEPEEEQPFDYTRQAVTQRKNPRLIKERNRRRSSWWKR